MRAPETEFIDKRGMNEVERRLLGLNWVPIANRTHDLGTDFLVACTDPRREDRGHLVGAQVKTGPSFFKSRATLKKRSGWWYYEPSYSHFQYWVRHSLPHLLILVDLERHEAFWQHVTNDRLKKAGEGLKIFVPEDQTLDQAHREDLLEIAALGTSRGPILKREDLGPTDTLRYALLAPFIVAPTHAADTAKLGAEERIAFSLAGRMTVTDSWTPKGNTWTMRFAQAMLSWVDHNATDPLVKIANDRIRHLHHRAAAFAAYATVLRAEERNAEIVELLSPAITANKLSSVDHGWLLLHRAWANYELGLINAAREDATACVAAVHPTGNDLPRTTISRAATELIFQLSARETATAVKFPPRADDRIATWRDLKVTRAATKATNEQFASEVKTRSMRFMNFDDVRVDLRVAELSASLAGDAQAWRTCAAQRARTLFRRQPTRAEATEAIDMLRRAGQLVLIREVCDLFLRTGPILPLIDATVVAAESPRRWTQTSLLSSLELIRRSAPHALTEKAVRRLLDVLLPALPATDGVPHEAGLLRLRPYEVAECCGRLLSLTTRAADHRRAARALAVALGEAPPSQSLERFAAGIDAARLTAKNRSTLLRAALASSHRDASTHVLAALSRADDQSATPALLERALEGDIYALDALSDVSFSAIQARTVVDYFAFRVGRVIESAARGTFSMATYDAGKALAISNLRHPRQARWDVAIELLVNPDVFGNQKTGIMRVLTEHLDRVPRSVRLKIRESDIPLRPELIPSTIEDRAEGALDVLRVRLGRTSDVTSVAVRLSLGGRDARIDLCTLLTTTAAARSCRPLLAELLRDGNPEVVIAAASAVGRLATRDPANYLDEILDAALAHPAVSVSVSLLNGLTRESLLGRTLSQQRLERVRAALSEHPSLNVRHGVDTWLST